MHKRLQSQHDAGCTVIPNIDNMSLQVPYKRVDELKADKQGADCVADTNVFKRAGVSSMVDAITPCQLR